MPLQISMIALGGTIGIGLVIGTGTALRQGEHGNFRSSRGTTMRRWTTWDLAWLLLCRCVPCVNVPRSLTDGELRQGVSGTLQHDLLSILLIARASATVSCKVSEK